MKDFRIMEKKLHKIFFFQLVDKQDSIVPDKFIIPGLYIAHETHMNKEDLGSERITELMDFEEPHVLVNHHATKEKERQNF